MPSNPFWVLYFCTAVDVFTMSLMSPVMNEIRKDLLLRPALWGAIGTINGAAAFVAGPIFGRLSDHYGRKIMLLICMMGSGVCYFMLGFTPSVTMFVIIRLIGGITKQTVTISRALVVDSADTNNQVVGLGRLRTSMSVGTIIGPLIGGVLTTTYGPTYPSLLAFLACLVASVLAYFELSEPSHSSTTTNQQPSIGVQMEMMRKWLFQPRTGYLVALQFAFHLASHVAKGGTQFFVEERFNLSSEEFGYLMSYTGIVGALNAGFAMAPLTHRFAHKALIQVSTITLILSYILMTAPGHLVFYLIAHAFTSLGNTVIHTLSLSEFANAFGKSDIGLAMGVAGSIQSLASGVVAPIVAGFCTEVGGHASASAAAALITSIQYFLI